MKYSKQPHQKLNMRSNSKISKSPVPKNFTNGKNTKVSFMTDKSNKTNINKTSKSFVNDEIPNNLDNQYDTHSYINNNNKFRMNNMNRNKSSSKISITTPLRRNIINKTNTNTNKSSSSKNKDNDDYFNNNSKNKSNYLLPNVKINNNREINNNRFKALKPINIDHLNDNNKDDNITYNSLNDDQKSNYSKVNQPNINKKTNKTSFNDFVKSNSNDIVKLNNKRRLKEVNNSNPGEVDHIVIDNTLPSILENIKVCVRVRPLNVKIEKGGNETEKCIQIQDGKSLILQKENQNINFSYTTVLYENANQEEVFSKCNIASYIENALNGYHATIFAYGQTGSGKTYTMIGREDAINNEILRNNSASGIIPKSIKALFNMINNQQSKYIVKSTFYEIYNEKINDLLIIKNSPNLKVKWNKEQGHYVDKLTMVTCDSPDDLLASLIEGVNNRKVGSHYINKDSSRSHSVYTIYLLCKDKNSHSMINFVDLAGSERLKDSKSQGLMAKETGNINKSLLTLGKVITALAEKTTTSKHIPYRDSKLTLLLSNAFGGSSKTLMIGCISPSKIFIEESLNTLIYASKAMNIINKPFIGKFENSDEKKSQLIQENIYLRKENLQLKEQYQKLTGEEFIIENFLNKDNNENENRDVPGDPKELAKQELEEDINKTKTELHEIKHGNLTLELQANNLKNENSIINAKISNLENVFIGSNIVRNRDGSSFNNIAGDYNLSSLYFENTQLKKHCDKVELEISEIKEILSKNIKRKKIINDDLHENELREYNLKLSRKIEFLQKRERELLEKIMLLKSNN